MASNQSFTGKVAVITGAGSGIGLALALQAAKTGMKVALADIEEGPLATAYEQIRSRGADVIAVRTDVSDINMVKVLAERTARELGDPWLVCNNAGVSKFGLSWDLSAKDWKWMIDVNLWGVINGILAFVPGMIERDAGHVVNTASAAGLLGIPGAGPYVASKHAVVGLSESLYRELCAIEAQVGVTVVCPALVNTNLMTATRNQPGVQKKSASYPVAPPVPDGIPLMVLQPEDIANQIFLAVASRQFWLLPHAEQIHDAMSKRYQQALGHINPNQASMDKVAVFLSSWQAGTSFL